MAESLSGRRARTLERVFTRPTLATVTWDEVTSLLRALNADVREREGSRVAVALNGARTVLHRPHPQKEMRKSAVDDLREFLSLAGVRP